MIVVWKLIDVEGRYRFIEKVAMDPEPQTLNQASQKLPHGVYTTFRTYERRQVQGLQEHFQRLEDSARLSGTRFSFDRESARDGLRRCVTEFPEPVARIRLTLDLDAEPGTLYVCLGTLRIPTSLEYEQGVSAALCHLHRKNPKAKQTAFIPTQEKALHSLPDRAYEGLITDDGGRILEGLSSNFFAVKQSSLYTAETGVLAGIARGMVLHVAHQAGIRTRLEPVHVDELKHLDEAFITSSSRGVLPLRKIAEIQVGSGSPGPLTRRLTQLYWVEIRSQLEDL
jgi:branched-chain amino acid aminotransferase